MLFTFIVGLNTTLFYMYDKIKGELVMGRLIITVAPTGDFATKEHTPYLPTTPQEIAESIYESWQAGAAIAHIHVRDEDGVPTLDTEKYKEVVKLLEEKNCDIIINFTTAGGELKDVTKRFPVVELQPELASYDAGFFECRTKCIYSFASNARTTS